MQRPRLVVLASGRGSNCEAIFHATQDGRLDATLVGVITNRIDALVLSKAQTWGVPTMTVLRRQFDSREAFDDALLEAVERLDPDLVILAGFMLKLGVRFMDSIRVPIMNIHPSLLPLFPGLHAQKQAVDAGVTQTGCTVHWVDKGLDTGPILAQRRIPIYPGDTEETVSARLLPIEHELYVDTIAGWLSYPDRYPRPVTSSSEASSLTHPFMNKENPK